MARILILEDHEMLIKSMKRGIPRLTEKNYDVEAICYKEPENIIEEFRTRFRKTGEGGLNPDKIICDGLAKIDENYRVLNEYWRDAWSIAEDNNFEKVNFIVFSSSDRIIGDARDMGLPAFIKVTENEGLYKHLRETF